ncbi:MAG: hypothetical protein AAAB13_05200 [Pseudomonas sp.]
MHTLIATTSGLLLLGLTILLGNRFALPKRALLVGFASSWLVATLLHGWVGMSHGQTLATEVLVACVVYGIPMSVLVSWYVRAQRD